MDHGLWKHRVDRLRKSAETINKRNQNTGNTPVPEFVHHAHPELGPFGLFDPNTVGFLVDKYRSTCFKCNDHEWFEKGDVSMPRTIRVFWKQMRSGWVNFNWNGVIGKNSVVHISACECITQPGTLFGAEGIDRHRGDAGIWVKNVRPHGPNPGENTTGGVEFYLQIDFHKPLDIATDITVMDDPESKHIV
jgi:hypothetical protein